LSDPFSKYLQDIGRYPLLTKSQEIMLSRQVNTWVANDGLTPKQLRSGKRAYEKLINCNLRLVVSVAKRFRTRATHSEMLDIVQEGNIGLAHGIKKFDPERGYALSTYVYWWIRQAITRYLSCHDRIIRLPCHTIEVLSKVKMFTPGFMHKHGRVPSVDECAEHCGITPVRMKFYLDNAKDCGSLDSKISHADGETRLIDLIASDENLMANLDMVVRTDFVEDLLLKLASDDRFIVGTYFGIYGKDPATLASISKEMGISRERVRQRFKRAMVRLHALSNRCSTL